MEGKIGFWLGIFLSVPLSILCNLITPHLSAVFRRRSGRLQQKARVREANIRKYVVWAAANPEDFAVSNNRELALIIIQNINIAMYIFTAYALIAVSWLLHGWMGYFLLSCAGTVNVWAMWLHWKNRERANRETRTFYEVGKLRGRAYWDGIWSDDRSEKLTLADDLEQTWLDNFVPTQSRSKSLWQRFRDNNNDHVETTGPPSALTVLGDPRQTSAKAASKTPPQPG